MNGLVRDIKGLGSVIDKENYNIGTLARFEYVANGEEVFAELIKENKENATVEIAKNGDKFLYVEDPVMGSKRVYRLSSNWGTIRSGVYGSCSWYLSDKEHLSEKVLGVCPLSVFRVNYHENAFKECSVDAIEEFNNMVYLQNNIEDKRLYGEKAKEIFYEIIDKLFPKQKKCKKQ